MTIPHMPATGLVKKGLDDLDRRDARDKQGNGESLDPAWAVTKCFMNIQPTKLRWLWPGRIPLGKVTLLAGDPGLGKSMLTLDMAARISNGALWPDGAANEAGDVLIVSAEDDDDDTIRPRLDAHDANVERIHSLVSIARTIPDGSLDIRAPTLADAAAVEGWIQKNGDVRAVIIDPVSAYLGNVDSHKNAELRAVLAPWKELAGDRQVSVVGVSHLTKASGQNPLYRVTGSLAFVAAARAVWCIAKDKQDPERRLFLPVKCNLGPGQNGLAYRVVPVGDVACIEWEEGRVDIDIHDALAPDVPDRERPAHDEAEQWLLDQLERGPVAVKDLEKEARAAGVAWKTVQRAKASAGVRSRKRGMGGGWIWELTP